MNVDPLPFATTLYNVVDITLFAVFMIASIAAVTRRREWHRRFTHAAALCVVGPAISLSAGWNAVAPAIMALSP